MRTSKEIRNDILVVENRIKDLESRKESLICELNASVLAEHGKTYGFRAGDIVQLRESKVLIIGAEGKWSNDRIIVRKIRKDGTPSKIKSVFLPLHFKDCKVVGHEG